MQFRKSFLIVNFVVFSLFASQAFAMRCGTQTIQVGDTRQQVLQYCGKPTSKSKNSNCSSLIKSKNTKPSKGKKSKKQTCEVYNYNQGPQDFIYSLSFWKGKLIDIKSKGYGK
jgi:hypothetical protein